VLKCKSIFLEESGERKKKEEIKALHNGGMNFVSRKVAKEQRRKVLDFEFLVSYLNSATLK